MNTLLQVELVILAVIMVTSCFQCKDLFSHLTAKHLSLWGQFSLVDQVAGDAAAGWQSPAGGLKAAKTGENSMAKERKEISVGRVNGSKQEGAQAHNFEKKGLQYVSIQIM